MKWQEWIREKYNDWRGDEIGRGGSVSAYARHIGVKQQTMNSWINDGAVPNEASSISALVSRYGGEVYDILGISPVIDADDQDALREIAAILRDVPRDKQGDLVFAVRAWAKQHGYRVE